MTESTSVSEATTPDMTGRVAVIPGGTGAVGEGVVRAWLDAGASVIIPSRTQGRVDQFRGVLGALGDNDNLHFVVGDYTSFDGAEAIAARISAEFGAVTDLIASIGGWWQGAPLWEISEADWNHFFLGLTTAHVAQVRAWIPRLPETGSYQLILGGSAETPVPGSAIISMEQAALLMMHRVVAAEVGDQRRLFTQILGPVDTRLRHRVDPEWVSAAEVGHLSIVAAHSTHGSDLLPMRTKAAYRDALTALGREAGAL